MTGENYARRCARAVFEIALEQKELDRWRSDLEEMARFLEDAELRTLLESPKAPLEDKRRILRESMKGLNPLALNLISLLMTKDRLDAMGQIAAEYRHLLDSYRGIERGELVTVVPLSDEERRKIEEQAGALLGKKVVLTPQVNPEILGGMVARIGARLLDGSARSRLQALRKELASG